MLTYRAHIYGSDSSVISFKGATVTPAGQFLLIASDNRLRKYSVTGNTMTLLASTAALGTTPSDVTMIASATAAISYSGGNRYDFVDVNTFATSNITTNANSTTLTTQEQFAGNPSLGLAVGTGGGSGKYSLVSQTSATTIGPSWLTGGVVQSVIVRTDNNSWILGTSNGNVYETTSTGTLLASAGIPTTPSVSSPTIKVQSLSYTPSAVLAATDGGIGFFYDWSVANPVLVGRIPLADGQCLLSPGASGSCVYGKNTVGPPANAGVGFTEIFFGNTKGLPEFEFTTWTETNAAINSCGFDPTSQLAWFITSTTTFCQLILYNMSSVAKVNVQTRAQNPVGTDVSCRVIRIRDAGIGAAVVETDQNINNAPTNVICTNGRNYIELGLLGGPPATSWDVREFQS